MKKWITITLAVLIALSFCGCSNTDYKKAKSMYEQGDYYEAIIAFEALGDYKDSKELLQESWNKLLQHDWTSKDTINVTDVLNDNRDEIIGSDMPDLLFENIEVNIEAVFNDDGSCKVKTILPSSSLMPFIQSYVVYLADGNEDSYSLTLDELCKSVALDMDGQYVDQYVYKDPFLGTSKKQSQQSENLSEEDAEALAQKMLDELNEDMKKNSTDLFVHTAADKLNIIEMKMRLEINTVVPTISGTYSYDNGVVVIQSEKSDRRVITKLGPSKDTIIISDEGDKTNPIEMMILED